MWIANDSDGKAYVYDTLPEANVETGGWCSGGRPVMRADEFDVPGFVDREWMDTLRMHPSTVQPDTMPAPTRTEQSKSLYLDLMQRLVNAVESGALPRDTFAILWGEPK